MTVHGFGGTDGKAVRVRPEDLAERARLCGIVRHRAGAVGINVCDLLAGKSGIVECVVHGAGSAFSEGIGEVMGVGRHAKAGNFSVNFRSARTCTFQGFKDEHSSAFAKNKAGAIFREWTTCIGRDHPHPFPGL